MAQIIQIDIRPDILLEVLSRGVLHCRREMNVLVDDVDAVPQDTDEYRRLIRVMDIALDVLESVRDFDSNEFVRISGSGEAHNDSVTLVQRESYVDERLCESYVDERLCESLKNAAFRRG